MDTLLPEILRAHKGLSFTGISTSFLCYDKNGEFVMAKRSQNARDEQGTWDQGGGGLKHGSTLEDNVRREVQEEYGAKPQSITYLGYDENFRQLKDGTPTHWIVFHFAVQVDRAEVHINEPDSFDDIGWFTLDTMPAPLHSLQLPFFEKYRNELKQFIR
jgi:8-oxo-dGTP diphosphatase